MSSILMDIKEAHDGIRQHAKARLGAIRFRHSQLMEAACRLAEEISDLEEFLSDGKIKK